MEAYRDRVEKLARQRKGEPIYNGSYDHAAIIVENMFAHARDRMSILSGGLNARVYGPKEVIEQAKLFLADPRHKLQILVEDPKVLTTEHPFLEKFWDNENVEVRVVPSGLKSLYDFHFLVMDGDSYRFESDKTSPSAVAAFGDKIGASNMDEIYASLWRQGNPAPYPKADADRLQAIA